jgi:hypothetical protein
MCLPLSRWQIEGQISGGTRYGVGFTPPPSDLLPRHRPLAEKPEIHSRLIITERPLPIDPIIRWPRP